MKFGDNKLIWENYMTDVPSDNPRLNRDEDESFVDMMDIGGEEPEDDGFDGMDVSDDNVVMSFDTSEPVKPEYHGDDDNSCCNETVKAELSKLDEFSKRLKDMGDGVEYEDWMVAKLVKASDYISDVYFRLSAKADYANHSGSEHI